MHGQIARFHGRLLSHGLVEKPGDAELYALDDEIFASVPAIPPHVHHLFASLNINSLILARPEPVRRAIIERLAVAYPEVVTPQDSESVTFLHDIPVVGSLDPERLQKALERRKGCIVRGGIIASTGTVGMEQAFVTFSSICFASFVTYFAEVLRSLERPDAGLPYDATAFRECVDLIGKLPFPSRLSGFAVSAPSTRRTARDVLAQAGRAMVFSSLVDSFFGNVSMRVGNSVYISQTGASLDALEGCIDCTTMDGSSTCEITSSSELRTHVRIYELTGARVILHGHPKFCVALSLAEDPIPFGEMRRIEGIPAVSGEVGSGARGIVHTLPGAMQDGMMAIVAGHGAFAASSVSVEEAFERLLTMEQTCMDAYRRRLSDRVARM